MYIHESDIIPSGGRGGQIPIHLALALAVSALVPTSASAAAPNRTAAKKAINETATLWRMTRSSRWKATFGQVKHLAQTTCRRTGWSPKTLAVAFGVPVLAVLGYAVHQAARHVPRPIEMYQGWQSLASAKWPAAGFLLGGSAFLLGNYLFTTASRAQRALGRLKRLENFVDKTPQGDILPHQIVELRQSLNTFLTRPN